MIGFYNYTVWLTYTGLLSAVVGLSFAFGGNITAAVICLMFSGLCDMFDGVVARTKKDRTDEEKRYGIQLDSLSDLVCFGVLPACIGYALGATAVWQIAVMAMFALCGLIRLAYFNVTEETRQKQTNERRHSYDGVPITTSALTVPLLFCFKSLIGDEHFGLAYTLLLFVNALCFICPLKITKPNKNGLIAILAIGIIMGVLIMIF